MSDPSWTRFLLIMLGGAAGSLGRYLVQIWAPTWVVGTLPVGTLIVNVSGCFAIGVLNTAFSGPISIPPEYRLAITVGILGGFTTFSSFGWETLALADSGQKSSAALYIALSVVLSLASVWAGSRLTQRVYGI